MFNTIINGAISIIFGLFIIAMCWQWFGEDIKEFFTDIGSMFKKRN